VALSGIVLLCIGPARATERQVVRGDELYRLGCSGCHGPQGEGVAGRGPSLAGAGEAGAYYQLSTGRMPLTDPDEPPVRKDPAYDIREIDALVTYVASLGDGPELPIVDTAAGDLAAGGVIFRDNCAPCHSAAGAGGALSYGRAAPNLHEAEPRQVAAALRSGPGQMPVFGPDIIDEQELDSVVAYVEYLRDPDDRGGLPLGRVGPIPEGFVTWVLGVGALLAMVGWIGTREHKHP
jgi:ubiquinol-cytochrome c reductase cytochrome c subunit